jgi:hypothetical protein
MPKPSHAPACLDGIAGKPRTAAGINWKELVTRDMTHNLHRLPVNDVNPISGIQKIQKWVGTIIKCAVNKLLPDKCAEHRHHEKRDDKFRNCLEHPTHKSANAA